MANTFAIVRQGESLDFVFDRCGDDLTDWTCTIEVKKYPTDTSYITAREITAVGNTFPGYLTSTETASLGVGAYRLIGNLVNSITDQEEQLMETKRFNITNSWAT